MRFNARTGDFLMYGLDSDKAEAETAGLTYSKTAKGPNGENVWFTQEPYAALPFWSCADESARKKLAGLHRDYEESWATDHDGDFPSPKGKEYMPFQKAGINYALNRDNCIIGDEMGLGKTITTWGVANSIEAKRVLIVCPASIRLNWRREALAWSTLKRPIIYPVMKSTDGINPDANFVIVSYDLARNHGVHQLLCDTDWDLLVLDEAHFLKSGEAQRTRAVFGGGRSEPFKDRWIGQRARKIMALTGTPLPNRPRECYTLVRALCHEAIDWKSLDEFRYRFNPVREVGTGAVLEKRGRLPELQARLRCNLLTRRLKADVLTDLPDKRYEFAYLEPNGRIRDVLARERLLYFDVNDLRDPFSELWGQISTIRREMGEAKVPRVVEHVKYLLDIAEVPKLVMFSHHKSVMDALRSELNRYGVVEVRGGNSSLQKQSAVDSFVNDPNCRIFSGQIDAAGTGIDGLQRVCNHVLVTEPAWTPGVNEQAIDRCHRIGQHDNVVAQFAIVEESLDERVLAAILDKTHTTYEALDRR